MFAKTNLRILNTLSGRLTITYALLSGIFSCLIVLFMYLALFQIFFSQYDDTMEIYASVVDRIYADEGIEAVRRELEEEDDSSVEGFMRLVTPMGEVLAESDMSFWKGFQYDLDFDSESIGKESYFESVEWPAKSLTARVLLQKTQNDNYLIVAVVLPTGQILSEFADLSIITVVIMLIGGGGIGWFLSWRATTGIKTVTQTAANIASGNLEARVSIRNHPEEIKQLAETFNMMIDRIHLLLTEIKDITNVIAHDLRSPLTRIRGDVEVTLRGDPKLIDYQQTSERVIEECDRLEGMINTMLEIASIDSGINKPNLESANLNDLLLDAIDLFEPLAEAKSQIIEFIPSNEDVFIITDRPKLQRSIANILDNAIKYSGEEGKIEVALKKKQGQVVLSIQDSGVGIPQEEIKRVFQPFYRCDRSRNKPGNGLGLSYVKSIIDSLGAHIQIRCPDAGGTAVEISFKA